MPSKLMIVMNVSLEANYSESSRFHEVDVSCEKYPEDCKLQNHLCINVTISSSHLLTEKCFAGSVNHPEEICKCDVHHSPFYSVVFGGFHLPGPQLQYRNKMKTSVFFGIKNLFNGFYNVKAFLIILVVEIS